MSAVFVELGRVLKAPKPKRGAMVVTQVGYEGKAVVLEDAPRLRAGAVICVDDDPEPWTVKNVHRCVERPDGTYDHSRCFD